MKAIPLNELVKWSPWPSRLLGATPWTTPKRTVEKVEREYDLDKYARCLEFYRAASPPPDPDAVKQFEFEAGPDSPLCVSIGGDLFELTLNEARRRMYELLVETLRPLLMDCRTVVECGCGYGYNLWLLRRQFPALNFRGGEFSRNAVQLAQDLYAQTPDLRVIRFNFYDPASYQFIDEAEGPVVVFTCHALEQMPSAAAFIDTLAARRSIQHVLHFEPVVQLHNESLLGLMQRSYARANDYNTDLLTVLRERPFVRLRETRADVIGLNPFNPTSVLHWQFNS